MEQYFAAKRRLFEMLEPARAGRRSTPTTRAAAALVAVVRARRSPTACRSRPTCVPKELVDGPARRALPRGDAAPVRWTSSSTLVGRPNVYNLLAATAAATALGVPGAAISEGLARAGRRARPLRAGVRARRRRHRGRGLRPHRRRAAEPARDGAAARRAAGVITVFGCGGDRDRTKRPLMGMVAARLSDVVVITSDNPRSEDPAAIIDEIRRGIPAGDAASGRTPDVHGDRRPRRRPSSEAVTAARPGDLVLIAGKGHEKYPAHRRPRAAVRRRRRGAGGAGARRQARSA